MIIHNFSLCLFIASLTLFSCSKKQEQAQKDDSSSESDQEELDESRILTSGGGTDSLSVDEYTLFIGTYTREEGHVNGKATGIHKIVMDARNGTLEKVAEYEAGINPSYLVIHPSKKNLYAVNEGGGKEGEEYGGITAMAIDEEANLSLINTQSSQGVAPCHMGFDGQSTSIMVANYVTGNITSYPLSAIGRLGGPQTVINYKGSGTRPQQKAPHAHYINVLPNKQIITADLGSDSIRIHEFRSGQLQKAGKSIAMPPGSGPRHMAIHSSNENIYVLNELSSTISVIREDEEGEYVVGQNLSTLGKKGSREGGSAAIKISPDGRFIYATNRGTHNDIAIFKIESSGDLSLVGHQSSLGNVPRDFSISPDGNFLVVANQNSDNLISFRINKLTGLLQKANTLKNVNTPVCVQFL